MSNIFNDNAYNILGLDISANQREIQKRGRDLINRIKIEDIPTFDLDVIFGSIDRDEKSITDAVKKLSNPEKKIKEFFFWFISLDAIDKTALDYLVKKDYYHAYKSWSDSLTANSSNSLFYKKNLAVLYSILLIQNSHKMLLDESLKHWTEILKNDENWSSFSSLYKEYDELDTRLDIITSWKDLAIEALSDFYTEISDIHQNPIYLKSFITEFNIIGEKGAENLNEILTRLNKFVEDIDAINQNENPSAKIILPQIGSIIKSINLEFQGLQSAGLYDTSETKIIRDKIAEALRIFSLNLNNKCTEPTIAIDYIEYASKISGTNTLQSRLKEDRQTLLNIIESNKVVGEIDSFIDNEQYQYALQRIQTIKNNSRYSANQFLINELKQREKWAIRDLSVKKMQKANEYYRLGNHLQAKFLFDEVNELIYSNISIFNFDKQALDELLQNLLQQVDYYYAIQNVTSIETLRQQGNEIAEKQFSGTFERDIFVILIESRIFSRSSAILMSNQNIPVRKSSSCCFVITATMGNRNHPDVLLLQYFRDTWLLNREWGKGFNRIYTKVGPVLADVIRDHPFLQFLSRIFIVKPGKKCARIILKSDKNVKN